jgi:hypothetical protein
MAKEAREAAQATGILPHEFLLSVARGEPVTKRTVDPITGELIQSQQYPDLPTRIDAAKAAAPYFAPKISTVEVIQGVSDDSLDAIIERAAAEAGISLGALGESEEGESEEGTGGSTRRRIRIP